MTMKLYEDSKKEPKVIDTNEFKYSFTIPIGDWSGDGHQICEYYNICCNKPIQDVFDAIYISKEKYPEEIHPDEIVCDYEVNTITISVYKQMQETGWNQKLTTYYNDNERYYVDTERLVDYILHFAKLGNPDLKFEIQTQPNSLISWCDKKKRRLGSFGYGLFV